MANLNNNLKDAPNPKSNAKPTPVSDHSLNNCDSYSLLSKLTNPLVILPISIAHALLVSLIVWAWVRTNGTWLTIPATELLHQRIVALSKVAKELPTSPTNLDCLILDRIPQICAIDERVWSESLTHPSILWHNTPRRVLILGPLGGPLAAETLRHFVLTAVTWISDLQIEGSEKVSVNAQQVLRYISANSLTKGYLRNTYFQYDGVKDELNRLVVNHGSFDSFFVNTTGITFDVILIDHVFASTHGPGAINRSEKLLGAGGILSIADKVNSGVGLLHHLATKFKHIHVGLERVESTGSDYLFYYASKSDNYLGLPTMSPTYVNALIGRRIFDGAEDLDHYDGESHQRLFSIPLLLRKKLKVVVAKHHPIFKGSPVGNSAGTSSGGAGITILREYFGCDNESISDRKEILSVVKLGLSLSHAKIVSISVDQHVAGSRVGNRFRNVNSDQDEEEEDEDDDDEAFKPKGLVISVIATLADGHYSLRCYPHKNYASAEYTSYDTTKQVSPEEILGYISEKFGARRTLGTSLTRGNATPSTRSSIDHWYLGTDYWMSHKVLSKLSQTAGMGQYARVNIAKGEVIFKGPIEAYLKHEREFEKLPAWRIKYISHMGEQTEDDIWIAPPEYDEDESYYTNHNCNANLVYQGYDTMIARRNIVKGEELTFDYATADSDRRVFFKCNCGASNCRGNIHGNDWMRPEVVDNYGIDAFWPHIQKKILRRRQGLPVEGTDTSN